MTADAKPGFDPVRFKQTTRVQWDQAAEAWDRWGPLLHAWLGPSTETLFDMLQLSAGQRVLDVAAGAGEQSLATDLSPRILEFAASAAAAAGLANIETRALDGEELDLPPASFDAVISRVGLIYFPDQLRALAGMRRALRPGGRIGAIVYSTGDKNPFFSVPVSIIRRRAQLPPPLPGQPGPFSLGAPGALEALFQRAGLREIEVRAIAAPVRLASAAECVRFEKESFGALHQMLSSLDEAARAEAWAEIQVELQKFEQPGAGFVGPCEMLVAVGRS